MTKSPVSWAHQLRDGIVRLILPFFESQDISINYFSYSSPVAETLSSFPSMLHVESGRRGLLIDIAALITLVAMILFVSGKVATKWKMIRKFQSDDVLMVLATVGSQTLRPKTRNAQAPLLMPSSSQLSVTVLL